MFLKRFPRYAGRARRGATFAGDHLRGTAVVVENAPKSLSRHDGTSVIRACRQRCDELVAETLVVPFCVIVHYVFGYLCLLFIHPRAPNLIRLRSAGFIDDDEGHATDDSSFQWRTKRRHVQSETFRRAGLWFVCIFGHDAEAVKSL